MRDLANWRTYEALEETIRRDTVEVALALRRSESSIRKWKECPATVEDPDQSGRYNPLDNIAAIISTIEKKDPERAYVPIKWLCARFGFLPPVKAPTSIETDEELLQALLKWHREIGESCTALSKTLADGRITSDEFKRCYRELLDDYEVGFILLSKMKARVE